jgi:two-component system chemotaxis response regulator CheB
MSPYGVVAFGGSAGAINAIAQIFGLLPATFRIPILVVQHLPSSGPISVLPAVLGRYSHLKVKWPEQGERPLGGTVYLAPRDHHMTVLHDGTLLLCCSSIRVNHCRPAVDPLFQSVARVFGERAIAVILSGLLNDGAQGLADVRRFGGVTMAQNEGTCMHFDMPRAAIDLGGCEITFSPRKIAQALCAVGLH